MLHLGKCPFKHLARLFQMEEEGGGKEGYQPRRARDDDAQGDAKPGEVWLEIGGGVWSNGSQGFGNAIRQDFCTSAGDPICDCPDNQGQEKQLEQEDGSFLDWEHGDVAAHIEGQDEAFDAAGEDKAQGDDHDGLFGLDLEDDDEDVAQEHADHGG